MFSKTIAMAGLAAALISVPAFAHHSHAMFDDSRTIKVTGTVRTFDWTNPHCWLYVNTTDEAGQSVEWALELGSPAQIARRGWRPSKVAAGDMVSIALHPLRDGGTIGSLEAIAFPDGTSIGDEALLN